MRGRVRAQELEISHRQKETPRHRWADAQLVSEYILQASLDFKPPIKGGASGVNASAAGNNSAWAVLFSVSIGGEGSCTLRRSSGRIRM